MAQASARLAPGPGLLKLFREMHGLSMADAAKGIRTSRSAVWAWEHRKLVPKLPARKRIASFTKRADPQTGELRPFVPVPSWDLPGDEAAQEVPPYEQEKREAS